MGWKPKQVSANTEVSLGWLVVFSEDSLPYEWPPFSPALIIWYLRANQHVLRIQELRNIESGWVRKLRQREIEWHLLHHTEPQLQPSPPNSPFSVVFPYPNAALSPMWLPVFTVHHYSHRCVDSTSAKPLMKLVGEGGNYLSLQVFDSLPAN